MMTHGGQVNLKEVIQAFVSLGSPARIRHVKDQILANRGGRWEPYASESSFRNTIQKMVQSRTPGRTGAKKPYYFQLVDWGIYQLDGEGLRFWKQMEEQA